jgi:hypothetical protein
MDVVRDAADEERLAPEIVRRAAVDVEEFIPPRVEQDGFPILGRIDDVEVNLRERLGHGRVPGNDPYRVEERKGAAS